MDKYSRSGFGVKTTSEQDGVGSSVYDEFLKNLGKYSATSEHSMYEELNAILNGTKPKYSSVEEAVKDMSERSGLNAFLNAKRASINEPEIFGKVPEMKAFIDNFTDARPGTSIEAVIHDLLKMDDIRTKLEDATDVPPDVRAYINHRIAEVRKQQGDYNSVNMHLGEVDQSAPATSNDPLAICEPNKIR